MYVIGSSLGQADTLIIRYLLGISKILFLNSSNKLAMWYLHILLIVRNRKVHPLCK